MWASVNVVPAGNPETLIWTFAVADVMLPPLSFVTVKAMVAVPEPLASALEMAGTSLAGERGTVKVDVVLVPCDGADGPDGEDDDSEHPTARMLRPTTSTDIRCMLFCLLDSLRRISGRG
jgi:hypothetical protein